jgi:hypothetical protein
VKLGIVQFHLLCVASEALQDLIVITKFCDFMKNKSSSEGKSKTGDEK